MQNSTSIPSIMNQSTQHPMACKCPWSCQCRCPTPISQKDIQTTASFYLVQTETLPQVQTPIINSMEDFKHKQNCSFLGNTVHLGKYDPFGFKSATTSPAITPFPSRSTSPRQILPERDQVCQSLDQNKRRFLTVDRVRGCERPYMTTAPAGADKVASRSKS